MPDYLYCAGCWWASTGPPPAGGCPLCGSPVVLVPGGMPPPRMVHTGRPSLVPFRWHADLVVTPEGVAVALQLGEFDTIAGPEHVRPTVLAAASYARELVALLSGEQTYSLDFALHQLSEETPEVTIPRKER